MAAFLMLSASVGINMLVLQPNAIRFAAGRQDIATGSITTGLDGAFHGNDYGSTPELIKGVQRELNLRGYEVGTPDGRRGLVTEAAIMAYEYDHGLPLTGEASELLLKQILMGEAPLQTKGKAPQQNSPTAEQVIRKVQQQLASSGYQPLKATGRVDEDTVRAIREFESDQKLPETGRISGQLVARLALQGRKVR